MVISTQGNEWVAHGFSYQNYLTELGYADRTVSGLGIYGKSSVDRYTGSLCCGRVECCGCAVRVLHDARPVAGSAADT